MKVVSDSTDLARGCKSLSELACATLVTWVQAGDHAAFDELVRRHRHRIFQVALALTRNRDDAEDVTQQSFLNAFLALPAFAGRSQFSTWIRRIAVNQSLNLRRDQRRRREMGLRNQREASRNAPPRARWRVALHEHLNAMEQLPEHVAAALMLVSVLGFTTAEAAKALCCAPGTVAWRIHYGRRLLRQSLHR